MMFVSVKNGRACHDIKSQNNSQKFLFYDVTGLLNIWRRMSGDPGRRLTHVYNTYTETTYTAV